ncbi:hypothetical protein NA56DRAFT_43291 [Hyaloscypha hepaticicola]|uniref:Uncharacterized protein n=1 Tax=Hyaloscypha hepaticicola TaxID=2082293 RepID=A0A2J6QBG6_9HELO|nr:hypothetical protein NA56DRAFT_43291 [Hyaloscypha hepaticicola]
MPRLVSKSEQNVFTASYEVTLANCLNNCRAHRDASFSQLRGYNRRVVMLRKSTSLVVLLILTTLPCWDFPWEPLLIKAPKFRHFHWLSANRAPNPIKITNRNFVFQIISR